MVVVKVCPVCANEFESGRGGRGRPRKYCSKTCSYDVVKERSKRSGKEMVMEAFFSRHNIDKDTWVEGDMPQFDMHRQLVGVRRGSKVYDLKGKLILDYDAEVVV